MRNHLLNTDARVCGHTPARQSHYSAGVIRRRAKLSKEMYLQVIYIYISTGYIYIFNTVLTVIFSHIEPHKIKILSEKCEHNYAIIFI